MEKKILLPATLPLRRNGAITSQGSIPDVEKSKKNFQPIGAGRGNSRIDRKVYNQQREQQAPPTNCSDKSLPGYRREKNFSKNSRKLLQIVPGQEHGKVGERRSGGAENLLNFHYAPMRGSVSSLAGYSSGMPARRRRMNTFNKETFLHSKCNFVVRDDGDYTTHSLDPDVVLDWELVHLVYLPSHDELQCPICLFPPTVAKITRCGHVYCWSCILHYLQLEEKSWRKCPICHEAVHSKDLKSAIVCPMEKYARKDTITMRLMKRKKGSLFAYPAQESHEESALFPVWTAVHNSWPSSRLMLASSQDVLWNIINKEKLQLDAQKNAALEEKTGEECYIEVALAKIKEQQQLLEKDVSHSTVQPKVDENEVDREKCTKKLPLVVSPIMDMLNGLQEADDDAAFSDDETREDMHGEATAAAAVDRPTDWTPPDILQETGGCSESDLEASPVKSIVANNEDFYYFYQSEDGQSIYVHPLNARCLVDEYGSLEHSPLTITGQILDFESFTMTLSLRKRFRYLSHVPVSGEFVMAELMLRPPVLSHRTIRNFMPEFNKRKQARARKQDEQRKFDVRAATANQAYDGFSSVCEDSSPHLALLDTDDFPTNLSPPESHGNCSPPEPYPENNVSAQSPREDTEPPLRGVATTDAPGPSFAQMLKANHPSPAVKTHQHANGKSSSASLRGETHSNQLVKAAVSSDGEEECEAPASFRDMFSNALLATPTRNPVSNTQQEPTSEKIGKKKGTRKKNKGQLLFATVPQRKY